MQYLSVNVLRVPIQSEVGVVLPETVVLQNVKHSSHLAEDEHTRAFLLEPRKKLVQDTHLPTVDDQVSVSGEGWA